MRVLGIDPGSRITGWGLVTRKRGRYVFLGAGCVRAPAVPELAPRVEAIYEGLRQVIARERPEVVALESIFHHRSASAALKLGHARGVALLAAVQGGARIHEYPPATVKQSVSGYGRADKEQVARMVRMLIGREVEGPSDVTDALAVALTHLAHAGSAFSAGRNTR